MSPIVRPRNITEPVSETDDDNILIMHWENRMHIGEKPKTLG